MVKHDAFPALSAVRDFAGRPELRGLRFLLALSGGPDSVALLVAMAEAVDCSRLCACWVDHGLRPLAELAAEEVFVQELCRQYGISLRIARIPRGRIAEEAARAGGIEAAARHFRYEALQEARVAFHCDLILTAHTADDWLETMIMRFFSGSGTQGLQGIAQSLPTMARPLLSVSKEEILQYLKAKEQNYSVDSTNLGSDFMRNRIRKELAPRVLAVFPSAPKALNTLARKASLDEAALELWTDRLFEGPRLPAASFFGAPLAVRIRALYRLALGAPESETGSLHGGESDTPSRRIPWAFMTAAASADPTSPVLGQGAGLRIWVSDGYVRLDRKRPGPSLPAGVLPSGFSIEVGAPGWFRIGTAVDCRLYCSQDSCGLRLDAFEWPIIIRSRRSGDAIRLVSGTRRVDRLLADMQVPAELRDRIALVEDRSGLVAVLGSCAGSRDIYRGNDRLKGRPSPGFLVFEMKGVVSDDAVQR